MFVCFLTFQDSLAGTASCVIWRQCIKKRSEFNVQAIDWRMIIFSKSNKVEIKVYQFVVEFEPHTKKQQILYNYCYYDNCEMSFFSESVEGWEEK